MEITWDTLRTKIKDRKFESTTWRSDCRQLLTIINAAEKFDIDPTSANLARISNLRDIIKFAKIGIRNGDQKYLADLFSMAANLNTYDLRKELGTLKPKVINYRKEILNGLNVICFTVTEEEFAHIQMNTKRLYSYEELSN